MTQPDEKKHISTFDYKTVDAELRDLPTATLERYAKDEPAASETMITAEQHRARRAANMLAGRKYQTGLAAEKQVQQQQQDHANKVAMDNERAMFLDGVRRALPGATEAEIQAVFAAKWIDHLGSKSSVVDMNKQFLAARGGYDRY